MLTYNGKNYRLTNKIMKKYNTLEKLINAIEKGEI